MQRIFQNLIENSVRAMPDGGQIKVNTRTLRAKTSNDRPWVYIEFKDEGPGITEENMQKISLNYWETKTECLQRTGVILSYLQW